MDVSVAAVLAGSPHQHGNASFTPDLQPHSYVSEESDNGSAHPTPSDMTTAARPSSQQEFWPDPSNTVPTGLPTRTEEELRKIHYIDSPAQAQITTTAALSVAPMQAPMQDGISSTPVPALVDHAMSDIPSLDARFSHITTPTTNASSSLMSTATEQPVAVSVVPSDSPSTSSLRAFTPTPMPVAMPGQPIAAAQEVSSDLFLAQSTSTAPSSIASTPVSTPNATPQTFARKRGRPRKHPLPDPNSKPTKAKRILSPDSIAAADAKKKATAAAAARSAASTAGSHLSIPDLGRLIPQGSSSNHAQTFIQNNLRLFADLFVALQKQAATDESPRASDQALTEVSHNATLSATSSSETPTPAATAAVPDQGDVQSSAVPPEMNANSLLSGVATGPLASNTVSGPSDALRDEIRSKLTDVNKGRQAIQAEMLQLRVDASFFETAQKTVDERITVLRDRIVKRTSVLQREREATRQAREESRKAKKDRKVREKGLRDSEREERRLAETVMQLEREIAAEEEERRRLNEDESSDEEDDQADRRAVEGLDPSILGSPVVTCADVAATTGADVATPDRTIGFSDEELAKVLGISTSELAGFSQTLDLPAQTPAQSIVDAIPALLPHSTEARLDVPASSDADDFDVTAFLEMAGSFGAAQPTDDASSQ